MRVIGLAGWSGAGKTTLVVRLIPEFKRRGLTVSTLKHAHHAFDIDQPGKDSFEHRAAGAREVLIGSARRWALVHELDSEAEPPLPALLRRLSPVDLVLVEGFKAYPHAKLEVHRAALGKPLLFGTVPGIRAIAADGPLPGLPVAVIPLDDLVAIAEAALAAAMPLGEALSVLEAAPPAGRMRTPIARSP